MDGSRSVASAHGSRLSSVRMSASLEEGISLDDLQSLGGALVPVQWVAQ